MMRPNVAQNVIDRAIAYFDPVRAQERLRARYVLALAGGYTGARRDRRATSEWQTSFGDANADILPDLPALRERSRDLTRNAPIARGAIATVVTNVVGAGLTLKSRVDRGALGWTDEQAEAWETEAERVWCQWADSRDCDLSRKLNFAGLTNLAFRSTLENGDVFAIKRFRESPSAPLAFRVQLVESDRVRNPLGYRDGAALPNGGSIAGGVEVDADGAPVAYHVLKDHPGALAGKRSLATVALPAFDGAGRRLVEHMFDQERIGQTRGVPYLAAVIEPLKQLDRYGEAEVAAAVISAMFTVFVTSDDGMGLAPMDPTAETGGSSADKDFKLASGAILDLSPGEKVEFANPGRPNASFDPFVLAVLRQIGVALELPFEILVKHFTASYSAARAAILEAWKFFMKRRAWLAAAFCQPCYEEVIAEAVARGLLAAPGFNDLAMRRAYLGAQWIGPTAGQLNPKDEVDAAEKAVNMGISTLDEQTAALTGGDWETKHRQRARERKLRVADGLEPAAPPSPPGSAPAALPAKPDQPEGPDR